MRQGNKKTVSSILMSLRLTVVGHEISVTPVTQRPHANPCLLSPMLIVCGTFKEICGNGTLFENSASFYCCENAVKFVDLRSRWQTVIHQIFSSILWLIIRLCYMEFLFIFKMPCLLECYDIFFVLFIFCINEVR